MKKNRTETPTILIIGGGLGGLALAQGLNQFGIRAKVFERDESPTSRVQGYRITLRSLGLNALSALLPKDKFNDLSKAKIRNLGDGFTFADEKMNRLFEIPQGANSATQFLRSELRSVLLDGICIEWNKRLISFYEKEGQIVAIFQDGSEARGDFLVGCDGGSSTVSKVLSTVYAGKHGEVPKIVACGRAGIAGQIDYTPNWDTLLPFNRFGPTRFFGSYSHSLFVSFSERADRTPSIYWGLTEEVTDPNAARYQFDGGLESQIRLLEHCKAIISTELWHKNLRKLIFATPAEAMIAPWLLRTTQFPKSCQFPIVQSGRITLLGDSAHSMPPDGGMGGSHVLEDARLLTELISSSKLPIDWPRLTAVYEKQMFARTRNAVEESEKLAQMKFR